MWDSHWRLDSYIIQLSSLESQGYFKLINCTCSLQGYSLIPSSTPDKQVWGQLHQVHRRQNHQWKDQKIHPGEYVSDSSPENVIDWPQLDLTLSELVFSSWHCYCFLLSVQKSCLAHTVSFGDHFLEILAWLLAFTLHILTTTVLFKNSFLRSMPALALFRSDIATDIVARDRDLT